ncbi:MAG: dihydropteroate synthase, partial [Acidimicrobiales bacterium]
VLLSASNKRFLGDLFGLDVGDRTEVSTSAHALGVTWGARIVRAHDVRAARRVCDTIAAILEAP